MTIFDTIQSQLGVFEGVHHYLPAFLRLDCLSIGLIFCFHHFLQISFQEPTTTATATTFAK